MDLTLGTLLPKHAFTALDSYLNDSSVPELSETSDSFDSFGIFVTYRHGDGRLRGCMGSVAPVDLRRNVGLFAIKAAVQDHRFEPLIRPIPDDLECSVSLLYGHQSIDTFDELIIGRHGVLAEYINDGTLVSRSTFLPEVLVEHRWGIEEIRDNLAQKAGIKRYTEMKLTVYESSKSPSLRYDDYKKQNS